MCFPLKIWMTFSLFESITICDVPGRLLHLSVFALFFLLIANLTIVILLDF